MNCYNYLYNINIQNKEQKKVWLYVKADTIDNAQKIAESYLDKKYSNLNHQFNHTNLTVYSIKPLPTCKTNSSN
jgi:hypothetical protein